MLYNLLYAPNIIRLFNNQHLTLYRLTISFYNNLFFYRDKDAFGQKYHHLFAGPGPSCHG